MDGTVAETCGECGFDGTRWRVRDAGSLFGELGYWWRLATAGLSQEDLSRRPAPGVWSALEYGRHTSLVTAVIRSGLELILARDGCALPQPPSDVPAGADDAVRLDSGAILAALEREGAAMAELARRRSAAWGNVGHLGDATVVQAQAALVHAAHDASHHFMDVGRGLSALGSGTPKGAGTVTQVSISSGGVPKHAIAGAAVDWGGVDGDRQSDDKHHGRPFQAVCLWSAEVVGELSAAGHPIHPGAAGENLTISGLDWGSLRPGARLRVGTALLELSYPAVPCQKQTRWFADGDFSRISHDRNPRWARWYAWVRRPGQVGMSDRVAVQP